MSDTLPLIMTIKHAFTIRGRGTVVVGRIECDRVKFSDRIRVVGEDMQVDAVCGGFNTNGKLAEEATRGQEPGMLVLNLEEMAHRIKPDMTIYLVESTPAAK